VIVGEPSEKDCAHSPLVIGRCVGLNWLHLGSALEKLRNFGEVALQWPMFDTNTPGSLDIVQGEDVTLFVISYLPVVVGRYSLYLENRTSENEQDI